MRYNLVIGVDVSKETLYFVVLEGGNVLFHLQTGNNSKGVNQLYNKLNKVNSATENWLFCLEHTGIYCNPILDYLLSKGIAVWLESASKVKAFHSLERGKNDALDALRIAEYAYLKMEKAVIWQPPRNIIKQLKSLLKLRERLLTSKKRLLDPLKEEKRFVKESWVSEHEKLIRPVITKIKLQLRDIDQKIKLLIQQDKRLHSTFEKISSVCGVGQIVAANTLVVTNEFKRISCPKKMACHCGVAPFKYDSGKSVRSRSKVSHRADKSMKALLHMAALSAINCQGELQDYYLRKVAEGKNKMSILNAIRNKIIHRIYACVRENRKYEKSYAYTLV